MGREIKDNYDSYSAFLVYNFKFPQFALDNLRHEYGEILTSEGSTVIDERTKIFLVKGHDRERISDTGVIPLGSRSDDTPLNDLVRYFSDEGADLMEDTVDKIVKWNSQTPILWTGLKNVTNRWFKAGVFTYRTFGLVTRWVKVLGSAI